MTTEEEKPQDYPVQPDPEKILNDEDLKSFRFVKKRIDQLKEARKDVFGVNLEKKWEQSDRDYVPHSLKKTGKRIIASDDELGWSGHMIEVGKDDWQTANSEPNTYIKVQTALSILVDRNPEGVFNPASEKFESANILMKHLYKRNWEIANSRQQLKLFIFNSAKYGWAIGRTYPLIIKNKVKRLTEIDGEGNKKWEEKEITEYNDVFRENLDPWNAWIDDMAKPNSPHSTRDWAHRKLYDYETFQMEFGDYPNAKYVKPTKIEDASEGDDTDEGKSDKSRKKYQEDSMVEVYFYENKVRDLFVVMANEIPVVVEPLPIEDATGAKKLSCWHSYWMLRHAESPYGVGIWESMKQNQSLYDQIKNMTMDQLILSIYKMFFYTGTEQLDDSGEIKIKPGVGKQIADPKNIAFLEVPGPGAEAWKGLEYIKDMLDKSSMVNPALEAEITGKTAFEIAQAKESALRLLTTPLDNISDALRDEAYITVSLINQIYSIPEIIKITDENEINNYLNEIKADPELYRSTEDGGIEAFLFREVQLGLDTDEQGKLLESEDSRFFRVKPSGLNWEGMIDIKPQSILRPSKELEK
ncbi:MAG: hypothetical protein PHW73_14795, partial [Atribacterota bacterium]|nr:hypothetical protein [Atribacterota bacterium]